MRWLGGIGGPKCGGGWYDPFGTTERTYLEQARQTVLGGARESMLFCYGSLLKDTGPKNIEALRQNIPELLAVAEEVRRRRIVGRGRLQARQQPSGERAAGIRLRGHAGAAAGALPRVPRRGQGGLLLDPRAEGPRSARQAGRASSPPASRSCSPTAWRSGWRARWT